MNRRAFLLAAPVSVGLIIVASPALTGCQRAAPPVAAPATIAPDPRAVALMEKAQAKLSATKTLSAIVEKIAEIETAPGKTRLSREVFTSRLMKPNLFHVTVKSVGAAPKGNKKAASSDGVLVSNGKTIYVMSGQMQQTLPATDPTRLFYGDQPPFDGFFSEASSPLKATNRLLAKTELVELAFVGEEVWNGAKYSVVVMQRKSVYEEGDKPIYEAVRYYIGADGFIRRIKKARKFGDNPVRTSEWQVKKLVADKPMTRASFAYAPPRGAKPMKGAKAETKARQPRRLTAQRSFK